jgi:RNA polymerase sigma factor (sigma-70 family)
MGKFGWYRRELEFDDLFQEMLTAAWEYALDYDPSRGVPFPQFLEQRMTWTALKEVFSNRYKFDVRHVSMDDAIGNDQVEEVSTRGTLVEAAIGSAEIRDWHNDHHLYERLADVERLIDTLRTLTDNERKYIKLHFFEEVPEVDIAEEIGQTRAAVSRTILKGLAKIARHLGQQPELSSHGHSPAHLRWHVNRGIIKASSAAGGTAE